jgi:hypothetical protein
MCAPPSAEHVPTHGQEALCVTARLPIIGWTSAVILPAAVLGPLWLGAFLSLVIESYQRELVQGDY